MKKPKNAIILHSGGLSFPAGKTKTTTGQPKQRFIKDAIRVGEYTHPVEEWKLDVDRDRIDKWVTSFHEMKTNGVKVPFVEDHQCDAKGNPRTAEATLGYIIDMYRRDDELMIVEEVVGDSCIEEVVRVNDVSIGISHNFNDGKGNVYPEVITHVGLTPEAVVNDQRDVIPIAASRGRQQRLVPVFRLSAASESGSEEMDKFLKKIHALLGLDAAVVLTEANVEDELKKHLDAQKDKSKIEMKELSDRITTMTAELDQLKAAAKESDKAPDPEALEDQAELVADRVEALSRKGLCSKEVADELTSALCGPPKARNAFMLSRGETVVGNRRPIRANAILSALEKITPIKADGGSQTGDQRMSRESSSDDELSQEELDARVNAAYGE